MRKGFSYPSDSGFCCNNELGRIEYHRQSVFIPFWLRVTLHHFNDAKELFFMMFSYPSDSGSKCNRSTDADGTLRQELIGNPVIEYRIT